MIDAPCLMLSSHFEGNPNDLTTNDGFGCLNDLSEHGVVLRLHKHFNDTVNDGRQITPPECEQMNYQREAPNEMRQVARQQPLVDRHLSFMSDDTHPIILADQQVAKLVAGRFTSE